MYTEFFLLGILNQNELEISALLVACLHSMKEGYSYAVIGWVASEDFYAHVVGARVIPASAPGIFSWQIEIIGAFR